MLSPDQILALAPDDSSSKAAKGLLAPAKWPTLGFTDAAIWGECQGSGSKPYQVVIEVAGPTFKCSCPSRKFPCKHGLALFLLRVQKEGAFTGKEAPPWVNEWLISRKERAEKQAEKKAAEAEGKSEAPADPAAATKREAKRLERMVDGASELERWLADMVRHGMADLPARSAAFWRDAAARAVDAQAPGLGHGIRQLGSLVSSGEGWQQRALLHMGRLHLLAEAMQRLPSLPDSLQHEVRASAGWPADKEEVLAAGDRVEDLWLVQGVSDEENERLWERRVWLRGLQSQRQALLLEFSHGQRRYEHGFVPGTKVKASLAFFPGSFPLRALLVNAPQVAQVEFAGHAVTTWGEALAPVAQAFSCNPWLQRHPMLLDETVPHKRGHRWFACDGEARAVPLRMSDDDGWQLLALSGGHPLRIFGEWLGDAWRPLSAWQTGDSTPCWTEAVVLA